MLLWHLKPCLKQRDISAWCHSIESAVMTNAWLLSIGKQRQQWMKRGHSIHYAMLGLSCVCKHSWFCGMPSGRKCLTPSRIASGAKVANFENKIGSKNSPRIIMPSPKLVILVSFRLKNNFLPNKIKTNDIE